MTEETVNKPIIPDYGMIKIKADNTYIIKFNDMDFQVTPDYPSKAQYGEVYTHEFITNFIKENPDKVENYVEPVVIISDEDRINNEIATIDYKLKELDNKSIRSIEEFTLGINIEFNQNKLQEIQQEKINLREQRVLLIAQLG